MECMETHISHKYYVQPAISTFALSDNKVLSHLSDGFCQTPKAPTEHFLSHHPFHTLETIWFYILYIQIQMKFSSTSKEQRQRTLEKLASRVFKPHSLYLTHFKNVVDLSKKQQQNTHTHTPKSKRQRKSERKRRKKERKKIEFYLTSTFCYQCWSGDWSNESCLKWIMFEETVDNLSSNPHQVVRQSNNTILIIITFKGTIQDLLQSPQSAVNRLQHVRSSGPGAIVCKSHATHWALITCNMSCYLPRGTKKQLSY